VLPGTPEVILDAAHNPDGARALAAGLSPRWATRTSRACSPSSSPS
jgi:folylpolyglutamate synthase/dihydropteroate synthase